MVHYTQVMGIAAPELNWVPAPNYVLRRAAILDWLHDYPTGQVLEMGCGPGAILYDLARSGFTGVGIEPSDNARAVSEKILTGMHGVTVQNALQDSIEPRFDYLMAFEVLEHIEDDRAALRSWLKHLKPGGIAFFSLPAHRSKWSVTDSAAGHFRRYDRDDIEKLMHDAGLQIARIGSCGWPLSKLIEGLRTIVTARALRQKGINPQSIARGDSSRTLASGVDRRTETRLYRLYGNFAGRLGFRVAIWTQRLFYRTSLGVSFLVLARKT